MPELHELSREIPIEFVDADTSRGEKELTRTSLPQIILPLINVDDRYIIMGHHSNPREKILASLVNSTGMSERLESVIMEKKLYNSEKVICTQDLEFSLQTGEKFEKDIKCSWRDPK